MLIVKGFAINNDNSKDKVDVIKFPQDFYNRSGMDVNQISEEERNKLISILKEEFMVK